MTDPTRSLIPDPCSLKPDPCPRLAADIASEMVDRALELLRRDPSLELADLEAELVARYGFEPRQVAAASARVLAVARRLWIDRAVEAAERAGTVFRIPLRGEAK